MGKPLTQEEIEAGKAAVELHEQLGKEPDIVAYKHRIRVRGGRKAGVINHRIRSVIREKRKKAIMPKVIVGMAKGLHAKEISKQLSVSPSLVKAVVEDRSFDKHLNIYQKQVLSEAREILMDNVKEAALKVSNCMKRGRGSQKLQLIAAQDILDRCGASMPQVTEHIERTYTAEETESILKTVREVESILTNLTVTKSPYLIEKATLPNSKAPSGPNAQSS